MATYAIYIKDIPGGGVEVHRQLESGIHGVKSAASSLATFATEAIKEVAEQVGDQIQVMSHTTIRAAIAKRNGGVR